MSDAAPETEPAPPSHPLRDRTVLLWAGFVGYLVLAVTAPVRPTTGWSGRYALFFACIIAFVAIRHQARARSRVRPADLPWVLVGGLLFAALIRGVSWLLP